MAAGQGFKTFTTGEVLTAGDVNGYLMQGINVFANATARDAAITSPQEGQFAYTKDNNSLWYYTGSAWAASGATGDIEGVTAGVGISGGGTSGTVTITNSMATAIDAKGDLIVGTGADTFSRIAVGANNTVLTADSTAATGVKWAASAVPAGYSQLGTASLSGTDTTISGLSGKQNLFIWISGASSGSASEAFRLTMSGGSAYEYNAWKVTGTATVSVEQGASVLQIGQMGTSATNVVSGFISLYGTNAAGTCSIDWQSVASGTSCVSWLAKAKASISGAISTITLSTAGGSNFDAGTITVYGA